MFAPQLVFATVAGYYPRVLGAAEYGGEPLILPFSASASVIFEFYTEQGEPISTTVVSAIYYPPDSGTPISLLIVEPETSVAFPSDLPAGGFCVLMLGAGRQAYPFQVLRAGGGV
jgi:hypothetical protein